MTRHELALKATNLARILNDENFDWHSAAQASDTAYQLEKWTRIYLTQEPDTKTQETA